MKKILITAIFILLTCRTLAGDKINILKKYFSSLEELQQTYHCIKAAGFSLVNKIDEFNYKDRTFTFISKSTGKAAYMKSALLTDFYMKIIDDTFFLSMLRESSVYGIQKDNIMLILKDGSRKKFLTHEAAVLIIDYGNGPDEESLIFVTDK